MERGWIDILHSDELTHPDDAALADPLYGKP
jgi:hypothetical protein